MATYPKGSVVHLRGIFWGALVAVSAVPATNTLTTPFPHGIVAGQTVAFLSPQAASGGINPLNVYGETQVYVVTLVPGPSSLQLAYTVAGAAIPLVGGQAGALAVLGDPSTAVFNVSVQGGVPTPYTPTKTAVGLYEYDLATVARGEYDYTLMGSGALVAVGSGSFIVD